MRISPMTNNPITNKSLRINTKSVRFRTTAGAAVALIGLLAVAGFGVNWFVGRQIQRSFDQTLFEQAADRAALIDGGASPDTLMTPVGDEDFVVAIGPDGERLASAGVMVPGDLRTEVPLGMSDLLVTVIGSGHNAEQENLRVAAVEATNGVRVIVGNEGENARSSQAAVRNILLAVMPLTALAGAGVAWFVTGRALGPVKLMRSELDDVVGAGDGRRITEPGSGDEIDELGATINGVLDRLDQQSLQQRQFVADASHELKSPLANARAIIDTSSIAADAHEFERVTTSVGVELNRLHTLVDDLLYLARADEGAPRTLKTIDLADLVFDEAERVAATSQKHIDASGVVPVGVRVEPSEAARAIRNLLENAERFAAQSVTLAVVETGAMATLIVADDGPGIAPEDRDTVFERFARVHTDRARSAGGTGLGLSIVASIITANGGAIVLTDAPSGGAQFELSFPVNS